MKRELFLDFDGTYADTIKAFCGAYNELYKYTKGFTPAIPDLVQKWNLEDQCPLMDSKDVEHMFGNPLFWEKLEAFPNANTTLESLSNKYKIILCTIGSPDNIACKAKWVEKNMPFLHDAIYLVNQGTKMSKSVINMKDALFLDDHEDNLFSSSASLPICFGQDFMWNKRWRNNGGIRIYNWLDAKAILGNNELVDSMFRSGRLI